MCKNSYLEGCDVLENFGRLCCRKFKKITNQAIQKVKKKPRFWAFIIQDLDLKVLAEMIITDYAISLRLGV